MPSVMVAQSVSWGRKTNSASGSTNFRINHGQATRSTLIFSRVIHFILGRWILTVEVRILPANVAGLQIPSYGGSERVSETNKYVRDCLLRHHRLGDVLSAGRAAAGIGSGASFADSRFAH